MVLRVRECLRAKISPFHMALSLFLVYSTCKLIFFILIFYIILVCLQIPSKPHQSFTANYINNFRSVV